MDKARKNQSARHLQGKGGVELLMDRAQSNRREKWEIKAAKREIRIKYPLGAP
jgi:hypothetical protein